MQHYYEKSKEISYKNKEALINKNEADFQLSTLSAEYLGGSTYKVTEVDGNLVQEKRVSLPILFINNFFMTSILFRTINKILEKQKLM